MKFTLLRVIFFTCIFINTTLAFSTDACRVFNDPQALEALNKYQEAYNNADSNAIKLWAINQAAYDALVSDLLQKKMDCLTIFDVSYSVYAVVEEFNKTCQFASGYKMDSIAPLKISPMNGCGGVHYTKLDARVYFNNNTTRFELPLTLVFLMDNDNNFKLMMQILNYKILKNEQ